MPHIALLTRTSHWRPKPAAALDHAARRERGREARAATGLARSWRTFKRLTQLGFPRRFPIVQFPNLPLIVAFLAAQTAGLLHGDAHFYARSVSYLVMTIWAYEELIHGVNWFRHLLGLAYAVIMIVRIAHALHA